MRVIANRQLTGHYGVVSGGEEFEADDDVARQLLRTGLVRKPDPPRVLYETKVIVPESPEAAPRPGFRDVPVPDAEPAPVASESDPLLRASDVSRQGASDPRGRSTRKASGPAGRSANPADSSGEQA